MARMKQSAPAKKRAGPVIARVFGKRVKQPGGGGSKRPRKCPAGIRALREIKKYQTSTTLLMPQAPFGRLVKEIVQDVTKPDKEGKPLRLGEDKRMTRSAVCALQTITEDFLVGVFEESQEAAIHAKRVTVMSKDMQFIMKLRKRNSRGTKGD